MNVPFAPGGQSQNNALHEEPAASHVGRPHLSHAFGLYVTRTVGSDLFLHSSSDVLPERVRPKGEPIGESDREPTGKTRQKRPRHRGR